MRWVLRPVSDNVKDQLTHEQWDCRPTAEEVGAMGEEYGYTDFIHDNIGLNCG